MCKFTVSIVVSIVVSIECPLSVHCDLTTDTVDLHTMRVGFITVIAFASLKALPRLVGGSEQILNPLAL